MRIERPDEGMTQSHALIPGQGSESGHDLESYPDMEAG